MEVVLNCNASFVPTCISVMEFISKYYVTITFWEKVTDVIVYHMNKGISNNFVRLGTYVLSSLYSLGQY
jgi:hypothetical protein